MTFLFTPRMGGGGDPLTFPFSPGGWYPREESHGGVLRKKIEEKQLSRVRVLKRRLEALRHGEVEEIEIQEMPEAIQSEINALEAGAKAKLEAQLKAALAKELKDLLSILETAQIEQERMMEIWKQIQDEELILFMMMS